MTPASPISPRPPLFRWRHTACLARATRCLLMALWLLPSLPAQAGDEALQRAMDTLRQREQLAGLVWGWFDGPRSGLGASGLADHAQGTPMAAQARVQVAPIAKAVTALAVLRLISQGRLELDAPLSRCCLPWPCTTRGRAATHCGCATCWT